MSSSLVLPDMVVYPERPERLPGIFEMAVSALGGLTLARRPGRRLRRAARISRNALKQLPEISSLDEDGVWGEVRRRRLQLREDGFDDTSISRAFALVCLIAERQLGTRPTELQLLGGYTILKGQVAEMQSDEDKKMAIAIAAATGALAGRTVHVVTSADVFTDRDVNFLTPFYRALGVRVGAVTMSTSIEDRYLAYRCDVTYCAGRQIAFDFLRDRVALGGGRTNLQLKYDKLNAAQGHEENLLLRGLRFAIVDDADRVLIDDAHAPLVITRELQSSDLGEDAEKALGLADQLENGLDFDVDANNYNVDLSERGLDHVHRIGQTYGGGWRIAQQREQMVCQALAAIHIFRNEQHYVVEDGKIQILDEALGRLLSAPNSGETMLGMIEAREGCDPSVRTVPASRLAYPNFFLKYQEFGAVTKTAVEDTYELWSTYKLAAVPIPAGRRWRHRKPEQILPGLEDQLQAIVDRVRYMNSQDRPVVIGACTRQMAGRVAEALGEAEISHQIIDQLRGTDEADAMVAIAKNELVGVVANIAVWRGRDVHSAGIGDHDAKGFTVLLCQYLPSKRIDRRVAGLGVRRGGAGRRERRQSSVERILSLNDPILEIAGGTKRARLIDMMPWPDDRKWNALFVLAQRLTAAAHFRHRRDMMKMDQRMKSMMAISGRSE